MELHDYVALSATIPGWTQGEEATSLAEDSFSLEGDPVLVEVGAYFGRCTVLMAGARKLRGSGRVHTVDPFDGRGDDFSIPYYIAGIEHAGGGKLRDYYDATITAADLKDWVEVHQAPSAEIAASWSLPIDLLLLDADHSPEGARATYEAWLPHLKKGGLIVLRNTGEREYDEGHDGYYRLSKEEVIEPKFTNIRQYGSSTVGTRV